MENSTSFLYSPISSLAETWKIFTKHAVSNFFHISWHFRWEKSIFWKASFLKNNNWLCSRLHVQDFVTGENFSFNQFHNKDFCVFFFSGKLIYKSKRKPFSCICIAWYKHSRGGRILDSFATLDFVLGLHNWLESSNPSCFYITLCKHGKGFLLLK